MASLEPEWSRLSILPVADEHLLVIDRENGKWVYVPRENLPLLQLLAADDSALPTEVRSRRNDLAWELVHNGLGMRPWSTPEDLSCIILKVTKACNFACAYCYEMEPGDAVEHMPLSLAFQALREALVLAPRQLGVILHGGEPTLLFDRFIRPLVLEGERLAEEMAKDVVFIGQTNLSRLTAEMVDFFEDHPVLWGISLDGPPEHNDRFRVLRNGRGTYRFFERALREFPDFVRSCGVMSVITAQNDRSLLAIARHFRDLGMSTWDWSPFFEIGQGRLQPERFGFSTERLLESWDELFEAVEGGELDGMHVRPVLAYLENFLRGPGRFMCMKKDCGAARDLLSISADGTIEACDCIDPSGPYSGLGSMHRGGPDPLERARQSPAARAIRSRDVRRGRCGTCPWLALCGGTCFAKAGGLDEVSDSLCRVSMLAFARISASWVESDGLRRYWRSLTSTGEAPTTPAADVVPGSGPGIPSGSRSQAC